MKVLVAISCLFAAVSAGYVSHHGLAHAAPLAYGGHYGHGYHYAGPQHLPVIGPNGVPLEPAENVARRAFHHAAHAEASARNGDHLIHAAPLAYGGLGYAGHGYAGHVAAAPLGYAGHYGHGYHYAGPQHIPVIGPNGVPLEPAANVAARSFHHAAHAEATARNGDHAIAIAPIAAYAGHGLALGHGVHGGHGHHW